MKLLVGDEVGFCRIVELEDYVEKNEPLEFWSDEEEEIVEETSDVDLEKEEEENKSFDDFGDNFEDNFEDEEEEPEFDPNYKGEEEEEKNVEEEKIKFIKFGDAGKDRRVDKFCFLEDNLLCLIRRNTDLEIWSLITLELKFTRKLCENPRRCVYLNYFPSFDALDIFFHDGIEFSTLDFCTNLKSEKLEFSQKDYKGEIRDVNFLMTDGKNCRQAEFWKDKKRQPVLYALAREQRVEVYSYLDREMVFMSKCMPLNFCSNQVENNCTSVTFLDRSLSLCVGTRDGYLRMYEIDNAQAFFSCPQLCKKICPYTAVELSCGVPVISLCLEETLLISGNTYGQIQTNDLNELNSRRNLLRKELNHAKKHLRNHRGCIGSGRTHNCLGSIRAMQKRGKFLAVVSAGRYLYIFVEGKKKPLYEVFLKTRLTSLLWI